MSDTSLSERDADVSSATDPAADSPAAGAEGPPERAEAVSPTALRAIVGALEMLTERVEAIEHRLIETLPPLSQNMETVDAVVASLQSRVDRSGGSLERAVMRLSARIQDLENQAARAGRSKGAMTRFPRGRSA